MLSCPEVMQRLDVGLLPQHRHRLAYAAIVLQGGYLERGSSGRWTVDAGHVVTHGVCESHDNDVRQTGTRVLNIPISPLTSLPPVFTVDDPDALIAAARRGLADVAGLLRPRRIAPPCQADWPDLLAERLRAGPVRIAHWARAAGLAPATVSRGFAAAFGTTPARYRTESQAIRAVRRIIAGGTPLVQIAAECGFVDQAHLCRVMMAVTGRTPGDWRIKTVQDDRRGAG